MGNAYEKSGVNVLAGYEVVDRIKKHAKKTERPGVMGNIGGFGGCFDLSIFQLKEPVLVSGTDGVGTKLILAIEANQHDTIGIDCVAMCVNDIIAQGATPLYFLDYIATGKTMPEKVEQIVAGIAEGCVQGNCALIGGETAEMPGMYGENDYDLAGFAVGIGEKSQIITGERIEEGDVLLGLLSSGVHSNGFSLVRKIFFQDHTFSLEDTLPELGGKTLGEVLLTPTRIYVKQILPLVEQGLLKGVSHITGGGFSENIPRMLPENLKGKINLNTWPSLPIFSLLEKYGNIKHEEMFDIFNMGIGMVMAVAPENVQKVKDILRDLNEEVYEIGTVETGSGIELGEKK